MLRCPESVPNDAFPESVPTQPCMVWDLGLRGGGDKTVQFHFRKYVMEIVSLKSIHPQTSQLDVMMSDGREYLQLVA
jgi:hypothetical protein